MSVRQTINRVTDKYSTDIAARNMLRCLVDDFFDGSSSIVYSNATTIRSTIVSSYTALDPYLRKKQIQIEELFKKYKFEKDLYSQEDLIRMSIEKFMDNQNRIATLVIPDDDHFLNDVIGYARGWIDNVLKDFDTLEHLEECYWAKKASVGIPSAKASIGERMTVPLSGSRDHIEWFRHIYLRWHHTMDSHIRGQADDHSLYVECDSLNASLVDKTFKSLRMIVPNTTIGGLYSNGLGKVIENRLARAGYDIKNLQQVHGILAREGSVTNKLVTADQSLASDNITVELVNLLLPFRWARALSKGRISKIVLPDMTTVDSKTFSTMGIGFTFPLQTLLFLGVLHGIRLSANIRGKCTISAYGDDLIYDHRLHRHVVRVFPMLGLVLNEDKTFACGPFRESCGQDFVRGFDVRPFQLKGSGGYLSPRRYEAFLYKAINGLLRRWHYSEVRFTIEYLMNQVIISRGGKPPLLIPSDYGDSCGIRCACDLGTDFLFRRFDHGWRLVRGLITFPYLRLIPKYVKETNHGPYAINRLYELEKLHRIPGASAPGSLDGPSHYLSLVHDLSCTFEWIARSKAEQPRNYRSKLTGRRLILKDPFLLKEGGRFKEELGVTVAWP